MTKTFNRRPFSVSTPSSSQVKNYFFNQFEFKGIVEDKNFLNVDQYSFQDAKNVYVDSDMLLRSRPSLRQVDGATDIRKSWIFNDIIVLLKTNNKLSFCRTNSLLTLLLEPNVTFTSTNIHIRAIEDAIFVFTEDNMYRYDISRNRFSTADSYIHVPITKVISASGESTESKSKNVLTTKEIWSYLYNSVDGVPLNVNGKYVSFELEGTTYNVTFNMSLTPLTLFNKIGVTNARNYAGNDTVELYVKSVSFYGTNIDIFAKFQGGVLETSTDGVIFNERARLSLDTETVRCAKFSQDGLYFIVCTTGTIYIVSLFTTELNGTYYKYNTFTDISTIYSLPDYSSGSTTEYLNADFVTDNNFAISSIYYDFGRRTYKELIFKYTEIVYQASTPNPVTVLGDSFSYFDTETDIDITGSDDITRIEGNKFLISWDQPNLKIRALGDSPLTTTGIITVPIQVGNFVSGKLDCKLTMDGFVISYITQTIDDIVFHILYQKSHEQINAEFTSITKTTYSSGGGYSPAILSNDATKAAVPGGVWVISTDELVSYDMFSPYLNSPPWSMIQYGPPVVPVAYTKNLYYLIYESPSDSGYLANLYSNYIPVTSTIALKYSLPGTNNYFVPTHSEELDNLYLSNGKNLYISSIQRNAIGQFELYLPEINTQKFNYDITNLKVLSSTEMGVFLASEVWYVSYDSTSSAYYYTKSKLDVGCLQGSDVISSYDGTRVIFPCERGLVSMSYQDFVASTDQTLSYLSDNIYEKFRQFNSSPVKLSKHSFWIICYKDGSNESWIYDIRNGSWWYMTTPNDILQIFTIGVIDGTTVDNQLYGLLSNGTLCKLYNGYDRYYDFTNSKIDWFLTSQKLHLGANNNYKHIVNMTFNNVQDDDKPLSFIVDTVSYRKDCIENKEQILEYKVDTIRTFVQRLNYPQVNEFQYILKADTDESIHLLLPLVVGNITVKYKISGQVR